MQRRSVLFLILLLHTLASRAQSIVTFAGGGTIDGQRVANIVMNAPRGLAFDSAGNLYMALYAGLVLRVEKGTTLVTTIAGTGTTGYGGDGGPAVNATLNHPIGLAFDTDDNLFIADTDNGLVRRVDARTRIITTVAGGGTPPFGIGDGGPAIEATLSAPFGLAIKNDFLYVSESGDGGNRVRRVDLLSARIDTFAGSTTNPNGALSGDGGPAKQAQLDTPAGLAFDGDGNLYIADYGNTRVRRIDTNGIITTYAGGGSSGKDGIPATGAGLGSVTVLGFDAGGNLCVYADPDIRRVDKTTGLIETLSTNVGFLWGLAFDADGTLYFSDGDSERVYTQAPGATKSAVFAGDGQFIGDGPSATAAILNHPQGIAFGHYGEVYVADMLNNVIRVITFDGSIFTIAGIPGKPDAGDQEGRPATDANIGYPNDIAVDSGNNLYISDSWNGRVWHVDAQGIIRTFAGGGAPCDGFGDGGPADEAVVSPNAVLLDDSGNLLIADDDLSATPPRAVIRKVDKDRNISTIAGSDTPGYRGDGGDALDAQLSEPSGLALGSDGSLFIADTGNGALRRVSRDGRITSVSTALTPAHLFFDRQTGSLYMADLASSQIRVMDAKGVIHTVAGVSFTDGDFSGVAVDHAGKVLFSDSANNRVLAALATGTSSPRHRAVRP